MKGMILHQLLKILGVRKELVGRIWGQAPGAVGSFEDPLTLNADKRASHEFTQGCLVLVGLRAEGSRG